MPELRQLRAFVAVAEELNFTRAAERLHMAQQAVSKSVGQLERELGVALLERTTREVRLTAAGSALLESGRETLGAADAAFAHARAVGRGLAGTVRVGVTPAIGPATREEVARVLRADASELSVSFHEVRPREVPQLLRDRTVDLVLARTSRDTPEIDSAPLRPTAVELVVPAGHRLASRASARLAELDGERLLTWSAPGTPYTDLLVTRLSAAGARVEPVQSHITGGGETPDLTETGTVALVPAGWPIGERNARVAIEDDISLPLLVLWPAGLSLPAVQRLRAGVGTKSESA
jgi:DNA-binding transcriptional LysR family regulator